MCYTETMDDEEWKEHPVHRGYWVSSMGQIIGRRGKMLKQSINYRNGYRYIAVPTGDGTGRTISYNVHRLVLETFVGPRPDGSTASHQNGDVSDNSLANLLWEPHADNMFRQNEHGTRAHHNGGRAKLTYDQAEEIRARLEAGERGSALALEYGVSTGTISNIKLRRLYKHEGAGRKYPGA